MKLSRSGPLRRPAAIVVGTWDPICPRNREVLDLLVADCADLGREPVAVLLDPDPRVLQFGPVQWPMYHDCRSKIATLRALGLTVLTCRFEHRAERNTSPETFLDVLCGQLEIAELWLGETQNMGAGGSSARVAELATQHGIGVRVLADYPERRVRQEVQQHLAAGRPGAASRIVGGPPARRRSSRGVLRFAWAPGPYLARDPASGERFRAVLRPSGDGLARLAWPSPAVSVLEFLRGPGDAPS